VRFLTSGKIWLLFCCLALRLSRLLSLVILPVNAVRMPTSSTTTKSKPHLVLHFDINETILVGDEAGGDTRQDCFNKMLAKSAFVQLPPGVSSSSLEETKSCVPTHWWDGTPIQEEYDETTVKAPPPLHTEWVWPDGCCPYYRTAYKKRSKTFVQHHGSLYRGTFDKLRAAFPDDQHDLFSHILPAFFYTLQHLPAHCTVVLRTFGTDLPDIAQAISAFARGQHPHHAGYTNDALVLEKDALVQGRWARINGDNRQGFVYQLWRDDDTMLASGDAQVLDFLHSHTICGIQDHYEHWNDHGNEPWSGKPVWVPNDAKNHHILFDDNM